MSSEISIQAEDFDVSGEVARLRAEDARVGAVCCFVGTVRDRSGSGQAEQPKQRNAK